MGLLGSDAFDPPAAPVESDDEDDDDVVGPVLPMSKEERAAARSGEYVPLVPPFPSCPRRAQS